jgi:hypothetical protein
VRFRDQYETQGQHGTQNLGKAVGNAVGKAVGKGTSEAQKKRSAALVGVRVSWCRARSWCQASGAAISALGRLQPGC